MINPDLMREMDEFELSARTLTCLRNDGIKHVWQLILHTEAELLRTPNFGMKGLNELKEQVLYPLGLHFSSVYVDLKLPPYHMDDARFISEEMT
jgi:DNA-directed RNA polymerase alpha subunit